MSPLGPEKGLCRGESHVHVTESHLACEQALVGGGEGRRGREEGEPAPMSQEFEYLHRKSRCKMLLGGYQLNLVLASLLFACIVLNGGKQSFY